MKTINTKSIKAVILLAGAMLLAPAFMSCAGNYDDYDDETTTSVQVAGCPKEPVVLTISEHEDYDTDDFVKTDETEKLTGCPKVMETATPDVSPVVTAETKQDDDRNLVLDLSKLERKPGKHGSHFHEDRHHPNHGHHVDGRNKF